MIEKYWCELESKFPNICLHEYIVMPNHFHGIIEIKNNGPTCRGRPMCRSLGTDRTDIGQTYRSAPTIGEIIQWFKTMSTNQYIK